MRALSRPERFLIRSLRLEPRYPPLFVVGAPRSGTTVVIQAIINTYDFGYFPNLARSHPGACVFYGWWARRRYRFEPSYDSAYGVIEGPMAPSDGWEIFHRWFPRYDHSQPVREDRLYELRNIVRLYEEIFHAPFANKNNNNTTRIPYLRAVFPRALWVNVTRHVHDTVFSVLKGREKNNVPADEWWGAAPPQLYDRACASVLERAVYQSWGLTRYVEASLRNVPRDQQITVPYESFCQRPMELIDWISQRYQAAGVALRRRPTPAPESFTLARSNFPGRAEQERAIDEIVARLEAEL